MAVLASETASAWKAHPPSSCSTDPSLNDQGCSRSAAGIDAPPPSFG